MPNFDAATIKAFFTGAHQMAMNERSFQQLGGEGIDAPDDLKEFSKEGLEAVFYNFRKPAKVAVSGTLTEQEPFQVSAKSRMRLFVVLDVAKYYEMTSRDLCPTNMLWKVLKNFEVQHKALKEKKEKTPPEVPR